jgi:hypothetical protein
MNRGSPCLLALLLAGSCGSDSSGAAADARPASADAAAAADATGATADARPADGGASPSPMMSFFISSEGGSGDLGGLAGADARCQRLAAAVGRGSKTWHAYLSTDSSGPAAAADARDRIGPGPWYSFAGVKIADNLAALHDLDPNSVMNRIDKATALDEKGNVVLGRGDTPNEHDILTGSNMDGRVVTGSTCGNWTSSGTGKARVGHHDKIGLPTNPTAYSWNGSHDTRGLPETPDQGCTLAAFVQTGGAGRIYCFAID